MKIPTLYALVLQNAEAVKRIDFTMTSNVKGCAAQHNFTAEAIYEVVSGRSKTIKTNRTIMPQCVHAQARYTVRSVSVCVSDK